ncbi:MAG: RHS repeat-associated core domain-containing protein [Bacilli bacterium]|nr:RHS repeat-associated core domain-containing protein [Bacilli bacterium]
MGLKFSNKTSKPTISYDYKILTMSASNAKYLLFKIDASNFDTSFLLGRVKLMLQISGPVCTYSLLLSKINHTTISDITISNVASYLSSPYSRIDRTKNSSDQDENIYLEELFNEVFSSSSFSLCFAVLCLNDLALELNYIINFNSEFLSGELFNPSKEAYSHEMLNNDYGFIGKSNIDLFNQNLYFDLLNISTIDKNPIGLNATYNYNHNGVFGKNIKANFEYEILLESSYIEIINYLGNSSYYEEMDKNYAKSKYNIDALDIVGTLYVNIIDFTYIVKNGGIVRFFTKGKDEIKFLQISTSYGIHYNLRIDYIETSNGIIQYHWNNSTLEYIENDYSKLLFTYNNGIISRIDYDKERYCLFTYLTYSGNKYLNKIKYCDNQNPLKEENINATAVYEYSISSPYKLIYAYDDLTKIGTKFEYDNGIINKIYTYNKEVSEYSDSIEITNSNNITTVTNHLEDTTYYFFDNYGRCHFKENDNCDIKTSDFYKYSLISNNKQRISEANISINSNLLKNPCFEGDLSDENHHFMWECGYSLEDIATQFIGYNGRGSLIVNNTLNDDIVIYQDINNLATLANKTLCLYGYVRGNGDVTVSLCVNNEDNEISINAIDSWKKIEVQNIDIPSNIYGLRAKITIPSNANISLCEFTVCEDFKHYGIKTNDNYVVNGGFKLDDNNNYMYGWTTNCAPNAYEISNVNLPVPFNNIFSKALNIKGASLLGDDSYTKTFIQEINIKGTAGESLTFSYFAKTNINLNDVCYSFIIVDYLIGGQKSYVYNFADNTNIYHLRSHTITTEAAFKKAIVGINYRSKTDAYVTSFCLHKEDSNSYYVYNENNSLTDIAKNNTDKKLDYNDNARVKRYASQSGDMYEYNYLSNGNISKISDLNGNEFLFEYDNNDNLNKQIIKTATNKRLIMEQENDKDGKVLYQKNYDDSIFAYEYDDRERLIKRNTSSGLVEHFTYNNKDLLINKKYDTNYDVVNHNFTYDSKKNLSSISISGGTSYNYSLYDEWGSLKNVILDNSNLNSFTYYKQGSNYTGLLSSKIYPNGVYTFIYDAKHRLSSVKYDNNTFVSYYYDINDLLIKRIDLSGTYYYEYDKNGRVVNIKNINNNLEIANEYDNLGSLQQKSVNINGERINYNYIYKYEYNEYSSGGYFSRLENIFDNDYMFEDVKLKYGKEPSIYNVDNIYNNDVNKKVFRFSNLGHMISYNTASFNKVRSEKSDDAFKYDSWNKEFNEHKSIFFFIKPDTTTISSPPTVQILSLASDTEEIGYIRYDKNGRVLLVYDHMFDDSIYLKIKEWNFIGLDLKRNGNNTKVILIVNENKKEIEVSDFKVDEIERIILGKYHSVNTTISDLENEADLPMSFDILYTSFGNSSACIEGYDAIYNDFYRYVLKEKENKSSGVIYYDKDLYSDLKLITLNGSLTSTDGLKPIYYSYGDSSFKLDKTKIFKLDSKKSEKDENYTNKHVYGSYNNVVGLDGQTKSILAYDFNFKEEGFISFRFKIDKTRKIDEDAVRTLLCVKNGHSMESILLIEIKDIDKVLTINYPLAPSVLNTNITIPSDIWHLFSFTWNQNGYKINVDNQTAFIRSGTSLFNFTNSITYIGCNCINNEPINQLNGMIEMLSYSDIYKPNKHNELLDGKSTTHITSYDELERPIQKEIKVSNHKYIHKYEYYDELVTENNEEYLRVNTRPCIETLEDGTNIIYSYDLSGNIVKQIFIKNNTVNKSISHKYDTLNRLIEEECFINNTFYYHYEYSYDKNNNILEKCVLNSSDIVENKYVYIYSNTIKDQLIRIDKCDRHYDVISSEYINYSANDPFRPSSYKGNNLTWQGRRLLSYGNNTYTYDSNGIRVSKTTSDGTFTNILDDNKIIKEIKPNNINVYYHYDEKGMLVGFNYNNNEYFYVKDLTGNIINIIDSNGTIQATYKYDAYGKILDKDEESIIEGINSFFYKGYYYDEETYLYYCNSRYYDPDICRWISIDDISYLEIEDINSINLWSYCGNNPVMYSDENGQMPKWLSIFLVAATAIITIAATIASCGAASAAIAPFAFAYFGIATNTTFAITAVATGITCAGIAAFAVADIQSIATDGNKNYLGFLGDSYSTTETLFYISAYELIDVSQYAQPGWGREKRGKQDAPSKGPQYGKYIKETRNGNDVTIYNGNCKPIIRYDYSHSHGGLTPHVHYFDWWTHDGVLRSNWPKGKVSPLF